MLLQQLNVVILIFPVLRAIANHTLNVSVLSIVGSNITEATNTTFALTLEGQVRKVGVFPATIYFRNPVDVYWISPENLSQVSFSSLNFSVPSLTNCLFRNCISDDLL